jgi:hypothetical protein
LQSINSEDAVTWSVFGTLAASPLASRVSFLNWLLTYLRDNDRIRGGFQPSLDLHNKWCSIDLWRRIPHPDTHGLNGPELDFVLDADRVLVFGEAKWNSGVAGRQGKKKDKTQLQLRCEFLHWAQRVYEADRTLLVLAVIRRESELQKTLATLHADATACAVGGTLRVVAGCVTWEELCYSSNHPRYNYLRQYYDWKSAAHPKP